MRESSSATKRPELAKAGGGAPESSVRGDPAPTLQESPPAPQEPKLGLFREIAPGDSRVAPFGAMPMDAERPTLEPSSGDLTPVDPAPVPVLDGALYWPGLANEGCLAGLVSGFEVTSGMRRMAQAGVCVRVGVSP